MAEKPVLRFPRAESRPNTNVTSILSLDGGGLRGIIEVCILDELELTIKKLAVERQLRPLGGEPVPTSPEGFEVNISDYFSVIAGTSTGALLAGYIAQNGDQAQKLLEDPKVKQAAQDVANIKAEIMGVAQGSYPTPVLRPGAAATALAVYLGKGPVIFPPPSKDELKKGLQDWVKNVLLPKFAWWTKPFIGPLVGVIPDDLLLKTAGLINAKYPSTGINEVCQAIFGTKTLLSQSRPGTSLLIVTYDVTKNRPVVFFYDDVSKGDERSGFGAIRRTLQVDLSKGEADPPGGTYSADLVRVPSDFLLWQTIRASTAAPTYFPTMILEEQAVASASKTSFQLADGAVVANNPSLVAMTFALSSYTQDLGDIALLSLGAGSSVQPYQVPVDAGLVGWGTNLLSVLMSGASELTDALARQMGTSVLGGECPPTYYDKEAAVGTNTQNLRRHFRRIQLTANTAQDVNSNKEVKVLSFNGRYTDLDSFLGPVKLSPKADLLTLLSRFDDPNDSKDLIKLGYLLANQPSTQVILREFAEEFLLARASSASITTS